jgi:uncharacterized protein YndB with AHSA1/START domain
MVPEQIERETVITAPVERVWRLLTEAEHLGRWFGDAGAEIDLRPGGALTLHFEEHPTVHGRVVDVEPERRFSYRWGPSTRLTPETSTLVEFTLQPDGDGTRLRVVESGFDALDVPTAEQAEQAEGNRRGWEIKVGHLSDYVARVQV